MLLLLGLATQWAHSRWMLGYVTSLSICYMSIDVNNSCNVGSSCYVDNSCNVDSSCNVFTSLINIFEDFSYSRLFIH